MVKWIEIVKNFKWFVKGRIWVIIILLGHWNQSKLSLRGVEQSKIVASKSNVEFE